MVFKKQSSNTAKIIRAAKSNFDKDQLSQLEQDLKKSNTRNFYKTFRMCSNSTNLLVYVLKTKKES